MAAMTDVWPLVAWFFGLIGQHQLRRLVLTLCRANGMPCRTAVVQLQAVQSA
jgi:hypothetical protein